MARARPYRSALANLFGIREWEIPLLTRSGLEQHIADIEATEAEASKIRG